MEIVSSARQTLSLVMLDLLLPGISGMEVLKWMRADVETQRIPVIVMTSERSAEVIEAVYQLNARAEERAMGISEAVRTCAAAQPEPDAFRHWRSVECAQRLFP